MRARPPTARQLGGRGNDAHAHPSLPSPLGREPGRAEPAGGAAARPARGRRPHAAAQHGDPGRTAPVRARLSRRLAAGVRGHPPGARAGRAGGLPGHLHRSGGRVRVQGRAERRLGRELRGRWRTGRRQHRDHLDREPDHVHLRPPHPRDQRRHPEAADRRRGRPLAAPRHHRLGPARQPGRLHLPAVLGRRGRAGRGGRRDHRRAVGAADRGRRAAGEPAAGLPAPGRVRGPGRPGRRPPADRPHPDRPDRRGLLHARR